VVFHNTGSPNTQYIDFGNYNYGAVAAAAGYTPEEALLGSGLYNLVKGGDRSGPKYNNPKNLALVRAVYNDYINGLIGK